MVTTALPLACTFARTTGPVFSVTLSGPECRNQSFGRIFLGFHGPCCGAASCEICSYSPRFILPPTTMSIWIAISIHETISS